ncbi:hypothetical protein [Mangrovivirga cuniculi]|nr:hypothetical protein [Mangrovivirga cuniculi]
MGDGFKEVILTDTVNVNSHDDFDFEEMFSEYKKSRKKESDNFKLLVANKEDAYVSYIDGYFLKSQILIGKKVVGAIRYHVALQMIGEKIVLTIDNPTFLPYEKNRFGNLKPNYGREMPLSQISASRLDEKIIDEITSSYKSFSADYLQKLKNELISG